MKKLVSALKKEPMLFVSVAAALVSLVITPPSEALLSAIDWKTLATLFMLLSVLDGFKHHNLFAPVIGMAAELKSVRTLAFFFVFAVFFSSMFVTNDVSLIIFVPLTMMMFGSPGEQKHILPLLALENIAAVRGSLLTPFGSPQNLFLFSQSGMSAADFILMMLPLWLGSAVLLSVFILFIFRKDGDRKIIFDESRLPDTGRLSLQGGVYLFLFAVIVATIVSRTKLWPYVTLFVALILLIADRQVFRRVDYVLLLTFFCFFVFSSSVTANPSVSAFLKKSVSGHEYLWSILLSQVISNVPAAIVLWPFTTSLRALIYGLDTAGLVSIIGSLASVINMRLYTREYPGKSLEFIVVFEKICLVFFAAVVFPQFLLLG